MAHLRQKNWDSSGTALFRPFQKPSTHLGHSDLLLREAGNGMKFERIYSEVNTLGHY
jgi:hypothetical protein